ncbi:mono/diheme cytochrome c family protein [Bradyrhizobium sp. AZCC 1693]
MRKPLVAIMIGVASSAAVARAATGPPPLDPDLVKSGHEIYRQHCASCHGANAQGAPNWQERDEHGELPAPPHNAEGHTWRHSDAELYMMVSKGWRDPFNKTERLTMPAFGDTLSPDQIRAAIAYLKTLWTPEEIQFQSEESRGHPFPSAGK